MMDPACKKFIKILPFLFLLLVCFANSAIAQSGGDQAYEKKDPEGNIGIFVGRPPGAHPTPNATPSTCGNGMCQANCNENPTSCPADCGCGNGRCEADQGETAASCPGDCSVCGDHICAVAEQGHCAADCPVCGDHQCTSFENDPNSPQFCPGDCDFCGNGYCAADEQCPADCCGDHICKPENGETCSSCPADCHANCGNGQCEQGETAATCPLDCHAQCGDGICSTDENCPTDCCGNGTCNSGETAINCPADHCPDVCGDHLCGPTENAASCSEDCSRCGDNICSAPTETNANCPADCPRCGDGACTHNETPQSCSADCKTCGDGACSASDGENPNTCPADCHPVCGDGFCTIPQENQSNCPADCGQPTPPPTPPATPTPQPSPPVCPNGQPPANCKNGICACDRCIQDPNALTEAEKKICFSCFTPETMIKLADGSLKNVSTLVFGDEVYNPLTKATSKVRYITAGPEDKAMMKIGFGDKAVIVTMPHPMLVSVKAKDGDVQGTEFSSITISLNSTQPVEQGLRIKRAQDISNSDVILGNDGVWHKVTTITKLPIKADQVVYNIRLDNESWDPKDHALEADGIVTGDLWLEDRLSSRVIRR